MLFSGQIIGPVEKIKHSKGAWEKYSGENVDLFSRKFVIMTPDGKSVGRETWGQNGS